MDVSTSLKRGACLSSVKPLFCLCFHSDRASRRFLNTSRLQLLCERSASAGTCNANCDCCVVTIKMQMSGAELIMSTNQRLTMPILQPINTLHFYLLSRMFYRPIIRLLKRPHAMATRKCKYDIPTACRDTKGSAPAEPITQIWMSRVGHSRLSFTVLPRIFLKEYKNIYVIK